MERLTATIIKKVQETPSVFTLYFTVGSAVLPYVAGQYITVYFDETDVKSGKAYSLSSSPSDKYMSITVKRIGLFSDLLCSLKKGNTFQISRPYGFFNAMSDRPMVAIAGGVGISPIWSMIRSGDVSKKKPIKLLMSSKTNQDIVFHDAIRRHDEKYKHFDVRHFITQEAATVANGLTRRVDALKDIAEHELEHMFYICGSVGFVSGIWQQLQQRGIHEDQISTETFFES